MPRYVAAHDLELFAINTGEFYPVHKKLTGQPLDDWIAHVIGPVMRHYCATIEPVQIDTARATAVATSLSLYYMRHARETKELAETEARLELGNVVPLPFDKLAAVAALVNSTLGQQHVLLTGNPADGFTVVGPFPDHQAAIDHLDHGGLEGWVLMMHQPD